MYNIHARQISIWQIFNEVCEKQSCSEHHGVHADFRLMGSNLQYLNSKASEVK